MESETQHSNNPNKSRNLPILLIGILSVTFAEVFSGSAPLWFIDPWGIFVVLPLYWFHTLILLNLAYRFNRTTLPQLYLWGVIFGLYESWMTKVIWGGYMDSTPQFGTVLGFAIGEFMIIALFWHAIFSFIVPILIYEILVLDSVSNEPTRIIPSHYSFLRKTSGNRAWMLFVFVVGAGFLSMSFTLEITGVLISLGLSFIMVAGFHQIINAKGVHISIQSLILSKKSLSIVTVLLLLLYIFLLVIVLPERIPGLLTLLLTIGFYGFIIMLIWISPVDYIKPSPSILPGEALSFRTVYIGFIISLLLSVIFGIFIEISLLIFTLVYLGMMIGGPILLILTIIWIIRRRIAENVMEPDA